MGKNVEIKARLDQQQFDEIRNRVMELSSADSAIIFQTDTFFDVPVDRLKLREFENGSAELIAYSRSDQTKPKMSVYIRTPIESPQPLKESLERCLGIRGAVVKRRELFLVGQTRIHLDDVDGLGQFLELEVVLADDQSVEFGNQVSIELMNELRVDEASLISDAYIDLLESQPNYVSH